MSQNELEREVSLQAKRRLRRPLVGELVLEVVVKKMLLKVQRLLHQAGEGQDAARAAAMGKLTMSKSSLRRTETRFPIAAISGVRGLLVQGGGAGDLTI